MFNTALVYLLLVLLSVNCQSLQNNKPKFIIDNDAGGDDAMAIFLALLYEKYFDGPQLVALTTGNGNTNEENVYVNNQKILKIANRQEIPIYRGSKKSVVRTVSLIHYYGMDGLGENNDTYTDLVPAKDKNAVTALIDYSKEYEGELSVITIGALTNVALAMTLDPDFLGRLKQLYIGAGHILSEEHPNPEFNALTDVEAYHMVVQNATADKVTILPYSQVREQFNFTKYWRTNVLGAIDSDVIKLQNKFERVALPKADMWQSLDPAVIGLFLRSDLIKEYKYSKNDIIMCGDERGIVTNEFVEAKDANVRIIYSVKAVEYKQFLIDVFKSDANFIDSEHENK